MRKYGRIEESAILPHPGDADPQILKSSDPQILNLFARLGPCMTDRMSQADDLAARLKRFAARVVKFSRTLPREPAADVLARQLVGAGTGESANYHSARRGRSRAEFISKLNVAAEEADEAEHWLTVIEQSDIVRSPASKKELDWLLNEAKQLRAILVASVRTARANHHMSVNR